MTKVTYVTAASSSLDQGRQLVREGFATTGAHNDKHVFPRQRGIDNFLLVFAKGIDSKRTDQFLHHALRPREIIVRIVVVPSRILLRRMGIILCEMLTIVVLAADSGSVFFGVMMCCCVLD